MGWLKVVEGDTDRSQSDRLFYTNPVHRPCGQFMQCPFARACHARREPVVRALAAFKTVQGTLQMQSNDPKLLCTRSKRCLAIRHAHCGHAWLIHALRPALRPGKAEHG